MGSQRGRKQRTEREQGGTETEAAATAEAETRPPASRSSCSIPTTEGPNYGEQLTFEVATTATDKPLVRVECYQSGVLVYSSSAGFFDEYPWQWAQNFTLQSTAWTGGAADCSATLYHFDGRRYLDLTSIGFPVAA